MFHKITRSSPMLNGVAVVSGRGAPGERGENHGCDLSDVLETAQQVGAD